MTGTAVGSLGCSRQVEVDARGLVRPVGAAWTLDWWVGADDRWRIPAREAAVRQARVDAMPVVRTALRVPGGDAVQHVYGTGPDVITIDLANDSPAPFVAALVIRGAHHLAVTDTTVLVDGAPTLTLLRPPARWAVTTDGTTESVVTSGGATPGPLTPRHDRARRLEAALLVPVAHRAGLRVALTLAGAAVEAASLPGPADAARGWQAQLGRGMQVELPDPGLTAAVAAARADLLLASARRPVAPAVVAALEDWGLDAEATEAWAGLGWRARHRAGRRPTCPPQAATLAASRGAGDPAALLSALRGLLVHDADDATVTLLAELPTGWRGQSLEVHDAPTRRGPVSYAVRWHGARPALLWEAPAGTRLRAPGLDPAWVSDETRGDALLPARVA